MFWCCSCERALLGATLLGRPGLGCAGCGLWTRLARRLGCGYRLRHGHWLRCCNRLCNDRLRGRSCYCRLGCGGRTNRGLCRCRASGVACRCCLGRSLGDDRSGLYRGYLGSEQSCCLFGCGFGTNLGKLLHDVGFDDICNGADPGRPVVPRCRSGSWSRLPWPCRFRAVPSGGLRPWLLPCS